MKNTHLAIVIASMRTGGAERAMVNLANGFIIKGLKVDLVLVQKTGELLDSVDSAVSVVDLKASGARNAILSFNKYLKESQPDIILASQNHVQLMVLAAVLISRWKGKVVLSEQTTFSKNSVSVKKYFQRIASHFLFKRTDAVVAVSRGAAKDFKKIFPFLESRVSVIHNPVHTDLVNILQKENAPHTFFNDDIPVIISAGRMIRSKRFDLLIKAFREVSQRTDSRLIIIGEGEERKRLLELIHKLGLGKIVSLAGNQENPFAWMARSELFVMASEYEGLPSVLIEALACGCKIVSTDCDHGPSEILQDGKFGSLVPVDNSQLLAAAMLNALKTDHDKKPGKYRALDFHRDKIVNEYVDLFERLLNEKSS